VGKSTLLSMLARHAAVGGARPRSS
jgi:hypothetical protein